MKLKADFSLHIKGRPFSLIQFIGGSAYLSRNVLSD